MDSLKELFKVGCVKGRKTEGEENGSHHYQYGL